LEQATERATPQEMRPSLGDAARVRALLAARRFQWEAADEAIATTLSLARAMPCPYAEAKGRFVHGLIDLARGEPARARANLSAAAAICDRLGERLYAERIAQLLADLRLRFG
jgi:hypothetical protein